MLRLILFTGIQGGDDAYYYLSALRIAKGEPLEAQNLLHTRVGYLYPLSFLFSIFGPTTTSLILPSLAVSLSLVAMAWWLGRHFGSETTGNIAAGFVALFPVDVFLSTTANTDTVMAFWIGLGVCLLRRAFEQPSVPRAVLGALCFGAAWATRESAPMFILPTLPLLIRRPFGRERIIAVGTLAGAAVLYLAVWTIVRGDPLYAMHVARAALEAQEKPQEGFLHRLLTLPSLCFNPFDALFPYTGGLLALSGAGCVHVLWRDRSRLGGVAAWWLGSALILILYPLSIFPYRPAVFIVPRFYAMLAVPGAVLAAVFLKDVVAARRPRTAIAVGAVASLFAIACAVRVHADAVAWRVGPEWAHEQLREKPGVEVLTDPRTAVLLRIRSADAPPYRLRVPRKNDAPPAAGTLLLDCPRQSATSRKWNGFDPPAWWSDSPPARDLVAEQHVAAPRSLRGARGPDERTALWRILP